MRKLMYIALATLMLSSLSAGMIDKFYYFTESTSTTQDDKDKEQILLKASIEKTKEFTDNIFSVFNLATSINENEGNYEKEIDIRKFYFDITAHGGIVNLRLGRDIKNFDYGNIYSIIDYLSSSNSMGDPSDRTLKTKAIDGFSLTLTDPYSSTVNNTASLHIYSKDITDEEKQKDQSHVIELTQVGDKFNRSIFIANETNKNPSLAVAQTRTIGNAINITSSLKYEHNEDDLIERVSSLSNIEYSLSSDSFIGIEYMRLGGKLNDEQERIKKHNSFKSAKEARSFYQDLNSKYYISLYTKISFSDFTTNLSTLENLTDGSRRINLGATYNLDSVSLHSNLTIHHSETEDTEFGYLKEKAFEYEYKFFVSYLWMD